ncbi:Helix-turn-helix [Alteribacillus persepolensis]|uniref:Helix-turn-helix n=1 Tax=Alteribacillus persepolensis TaxID=568899 RepID=A0A1G8IGT4_9BACI|nr:helix-turn-helix transcriptional regulator [Alteribacillus persepolensis]SDI18124.1 Helix-turn-helix [Alteribacillus persepolensis]
MEYGAILKACRKRAGMTQEELAERLHMGQSDISRYESDKQEPTISLFKAWTENTQSPEVMAAFLLGIDGVTMMQQIMMTFGSAIGMILMGA